MADELDMMPDGWWCKKCGRATDPEKWESTGIKLAPWRCPRCKCLCKPKPVRCTLFPVRNQELTLPME